MQITKLPPGSAKGSEPQTMKGATKSARNSYNRLYRPLSDLRVRPGGIPKGVMFAREAAQNG